MPDPRQLQDHRLNKDELESYRYSVVLIGRGTEWRSFAISLSLSLIFVTMGSMWYFQERFSSITKPWYFMKTLDSSLIYILQFHYQTCKVLVSKQVAFW